MGNTLVTGGVTAWAVDEQFVDLICGDADLVAAEFDAIIAAEWPTRPADEHPGGGETPCAAGAVGGPVFRRRPPGIAKWARQRSPPSQRPGPRPGPRPSAPSSPVSTMTTNRPDPYAVLGVPPSATQAEISHAFRALLRRHHPDTHATEDKPSSGVCDTMLEQVLAASTVLRDPARRADYDREAALRARPASPPSPQAVSHHLADGWPPIVAGPVRWHRPADRRPP